MHLAARNGTLCAPPSVYSYTRFSTAEQAQGDSFRRQAEAARKWASQRGMILDERLSLRDLGVSAYRGANTDTDAGLGAFLTACRSGLIGEGSYLLVESLDRLSRMTPLLAQRLFGDIVLAGVTIVTLNDGQEYIPVMTRGTMWHRSAVAKLLRNPAVIGTLVTGHIDYGTGKRQRITSTPIPAFYPAAVTPEQWAAVRALKDGTIARARGKSASAPVQNMLAGLARCPDCGAAMTRVYKGSRAKAGPAKLVCTRAKAGAATHGYVSVSLEAVHDAIASDYAKLIADVPAGDRAPALDSEAVNLQGEIMAAEDSLADLLDLLDREPSQALARRIRAAEASLSVLRKDLEGIEQARAVADGGMVHTRLEALADAFDTPTNTGGINAALRLLFAGVTIDHREGLLQFQWRQGGTTSLRYAFAADVF